MMKKKRILAILLVFGLMFSFAGCVKTKQSEQKKLEGSWALLNEKGEQCPIVLNFDEKGRVWFKYDRSISADDDAAEAFVQNLLESSGLSSVAEEYGISAILKAETISGALEKLSELAQLTYQVKGNDKIELTASFLFGALKHSWDVGYFFDGDSLSLDGVKYQQIR